MNLLHEIEDFLASTKTRSFDKYLLGPFLIWYGLKYRKSNKLARRLLITAGIWQLYYSWNHYRALPENIKDVPTLLLTSVTTSTGLAEL